MKKLLTIAGSDSSGGAGIQADLKTFCVNGVYGMSVITAVTAQNTCGVYGIEDISCEIIEKQLEAVFEDIFPDGVKIGMLSSCEIIDTVSEFLKKYKPKNIVLDPVMVSTSGARLIAKNACESLKEKLFPLADIITPNIPEAEVIWGKEIKNQEDMENAARCIGEEYGISVLVKGGHRSDNCNDILYADGEITILKGEKIHNPNTHGTGCTLSSAIAANMAKGMAVCEATKKSKEYLTNALKAQLDLGKGSGPLMHNYEQEKKHG